MFTSNFQCFVPSIYALCLNFLSDHSVFFNIMVGFNRLYFVLIALILHSIDAFRAPMLSCTASKRIAPLNRRQTQLKDTNLQSLLLTSPLPVLVDFYADWCGPCRLMAPELVEIEKRLKGRVHVTKVDTSKSMDLCSKYSVNALPTLILFNKGKELER